MDRKTRLEITVLVWEFTAGSREKNYILLFLPRTSETNVWRELSRTATFLNFVL